MATRHGIAAGAVLAAALGGCVVPPPPYQVGGGASYSLIRSDYSALEDQGAAGVALVAGWEMSDTWWLDAYATVGHQLEAGTTQNIFYPPDGAEYGLFCLNLRKEFWPPERRGWAPWVSGGLAVGSVIWDSYLYELAGSGLVVGAGVDVRLGHGPGALRAQVQYDRLSVEDNYGYGPYGIDGMVGSVLLVWTFGEENAAATD